MSNAINANNRYKTKQMIKVEKENENLELRKRLKSATKDKYAKKENVWNRLSRVRKSPSSENMPLNRSRQNMPIKPSQRFQIMKQVAINQQLFHQQSQQQSSRRPLTPNSGTNRRSYEVQKAIVVPEIDNRDVLYVCKPIKSVKELLTARSLSNSKSSSNNFELTYQPSFTAMSSPHSPTLSQHQHYVTASDKVLVSNSEDSADDYKSAPSMSSRSYYKLNNSASIMHNFHEVLQARGESSMEPDKMEMVKNVLKYDERYPQLDTNNPKLFKDILKAQLQDILKHEHAVKQALQKLDSSHSLQSCHEVQTQQPIDEIVPYATPSKEPKKLEVDVVFKNVPSLEKEIIILRALGEKLEATLNRTSFKRCSHSLSRESIAVNTGPSLLNTSGKNRLFMLVEIKSHSYILALESYARSSIISKGLVRVTGVVQEFRIEQKSIVELKEEANRQFYIPINPETAELKRTSFKKLKENPDLLMRHIKATNSSVPFNILDHDPVFFNNILFNTKCNECPEASVDISTVDNETPKEKPSQAMVLCEGGDSRQFHRKDSNVKKVVELNGELAISTELMQPIIRGKERRRIRHSLTPFTAKETVVSPKNTLFKTILVGTVQISCFMLLIMAFTFPDAKC